MPGGGRAEAGLHQIIGQRLREVAAQVGAPVNASANCKANIEIVFTTAPQALLDNIRKNQEMFLGYADNSAQRDELARVTRPIQAWYTTQIKDLNGKTFWESPKVAGAGDEIQIPCPQCASRYMELHSAIGATTVTGARLGDGLHSALYHVIIVADPGKLAQHEVGTLADYIALVALAQISSLDACQTLPSIVNLLAAGCDHGTTALTVSDLGYLRGLYKMSPGRTLRTQQDEVIYQMQQSQDGK